VERVGTSSQSLVTPSRHRYSARLHRPSLAGGFPCEYGAKLFEIVIMSKKGYAGGGSLGRVLEDFRKASVFL
jgi:hypothetical protein